MVQKTDIMFERFMKLERIDTPNLIGFKSVKHISEIDGNEGVIIPCKQASFYQLCDLFEGKKVKIYQTEDWEHWMVEVI